jgi:hypothetical protein
MEVVVAFVILMLVLVPIATLLANSIGQAASSRERLTALSLAEQYIELLNNTPLDGTRNKTPNDSTLPVTDESIKQTTSPLTRSTVGYTVYARFTWAPAEDTTPDLCISGLVPTLLDLQVTVEWSHSKDQISDTTLINYPPSGILTDGFLAIKVDGDPATNPPADADGRPWTTRVKAVPVTIKPHATVTGFTTVTIYPNRYGCVFEEVPPGKYTVTVADPSPGLPSGIPSGTNYGTPSWVASYGEELTETGQAPSTVTVGDVTTVTFEYDEGSMVDLTYPSTTVVEGDVTCPNAGSILCMAAGQSPTSAAAPTKHPKADLSVLTSSGWTVYQPPATRLAATACAGTKRCVSVGYTASGATTTTFSGASVSTPTGTVQFTADTVPSGTSALEGITCPGTSTCYAYGEGSTSSSAVILSGTVGTTSVTWKTDGGLTGVSTVSALTCPTTTSCYALGKTSAGPTILSLVATGSSWSADTLPTTPSAVSTVSQLACHSTTCFVLGSTSSRALVLSLSTGSTTTWIEDTVPTVSTLTQIKCPSTTVCYAVGTASTTATILSLWSVTGTTNKVTWTTDTLPSAVTALTLLKCPSTSACYATGSSAAGPVIVSLLTATNWTTDSLPSTVKSLSGLTCTSSSQCAATGTATVGGNVRGVVLSLKAPISWTQDALPSGIAPVYFAGVACTSTGSTCAAPGASLTGAIFLSATLAGATWEKDTPSGLVGMSLDDTPISVYNVNLSPLTIQEMAAPSSGNVSAIGPLFPFTSGYQVAAAECAAQVTPTATSVSSIPRGTATAALAMGLLPIEVVSATGVPVAGATVTITPACTKLTPPAGSADQTSFSLERTGPSGLSETAVMYGPYTVSVTSGALTATATITVAQTGTEVGSVTTQLPSPVVVTL